jgi:quercetin dioxygenase-like cupin family protein
MPDQGFVIDSKDVEAFTPAGCEGKFSSRMLIDFTNARSSQLVVNEFTLKAGQDTNPGTHPPPYDEVYYVLNGKGLLLLGDAEVEQHEMETGFVAFIPAGTVHSLHNPYSADLVLLTFMPRQPLPGVNPLYDERKEKWGTSFRLKRRAAGCQEPIKT